MAGRIQNRMAGMLATSDNSGDRQLQKSLGCTTNPLPCHWLCVPKLQSSSAWSLQKNSLSLNLPRVCSGKVARTGKQYTCKTIQFPGHVNLTIWLKILQTFKKNKRVQVHSIVATVPLPKHEFQLVPDKHSL